MALSERTLALLRDIEEDHPSVAKDLRIKLPTNNDEIMMNNCLYGDIVWVLGHEVVMFQKLPRDEGKAKYRLVMADDAEASEIEQYASKNIAREAMRIHKRVMDGYDRLRGHCDNDDESERAYKIFRVEVENWEDKI